MADEEVIAALRIPKWTLDEMELRALRRSIAEEVFESLCLCDKVDPRELTVSELLALLAQKVQS